MEGTLSLTVGAIGKINSKEVRSQENMMPVLQVTQLILVHTQKDRFRVVLSDGTESHEGILNASLNGLIRDGILRTGSIVRLTKFTVRDVLTRRLVVVVELEVIATHCGNHHRGARGPGVTNGFVSSFESTLRI